jgi:hypothetical protein
LSALNAERAELGWNTHRPVDLDVHVRTVVTDQELSSGASKYSADGLDAVDIWIVFKVAPVGLNSTIVPAWCCATQTLPALSMASTLAPQGLQH